MISRITTSLAAGFKSQTSPRVRVTCEKRWPGFKALKIFCQCLSLIASDFRSDNNGLILRCWRRTFWICSKAAYCRIRLGISLVILMRLSIDWRSFLVWTLVQSISRRSFKLFQIVDKAAHTDMKSWTSSKIAGNDDSALAGKSKASLAFETISNSDWRPSKRDWNELSVREASSGGMVPDTGFSSFHCTIISLILSPMTLSSAVILARKASVWSWRARVVWPCLKRSTWGSHTLALRLHCCTIVIKDTACAVEEASKVWPSRSRRALAISECTSRIWPPSLEPNFCNISCCHWSYLALTLVWTCS